MSLSGTNGVTDSRGAGRRCHSLSSPTSPPASLGVAGRSVSSRTRAAGSERERRRAIVEQGVGEAVDASSDKRRCETQRRIQAGALRVTTVGDEVALPVEASENSMQHRLKR